MYVDVGVGWREDRKSSEARTAASLPLPENSLMEMPILSTRAYAPLKKSTGGEKRRGSTEIVPETAADLSLQARPGLGSPGEGGDKSPVRCTACVVFTTLRLGRNGRENTAMPPPCSTARNM